MLVLLGTVQAALNNAQAARATFTRALEANRDSLDAIAGLVSLDLKGGALAEARQRVDQALASHANNAGYLMLAASVYAAQNDMARTEQALRQALTIEPANASAALSLADALSRQRQAGAAIKVLEQLLTRWPGLCVIIITGYSTESSAIEAANLGVNGYLTKPFRVSQVLGKTAKALGIEE